MYCIFTGAIPTSPSSYRRPIYIRDLNCSGNEINIWNCSHTVPSTGYCYSAVVICQSMLIIYTVDFILLLFLQLLILPLILHVLMVMFVWLVGLVN